MIFYIFFQVFFFLQQNLNEKLQFLHLKTFGVYFIPLYPYRVNFLFVKQNNFYHLSFHRNLSQLNGLLPTVASINLPTPSFSHHICKCQFDGALKVLKYLNRFWNAWIELKSRRRRRTPFDLHNYFKIVKTMRILATLIQPWRVRQHERKTCLTF